MPIYGIPHRYCENTEGTNLKQLARAVALELAYFTSKLMDPVEPPSAR